MTNMKIRRRQPNPSVTLESWRYQVPLPDASHILEEIVWHKERNANLEKNFLADLQRQALKIIANL